VLAIRPVIVRLRFRFDSLMMTSESPFFWRMKHDEEFGVVVQEEGLG
jgi:hypothetical protein